MTNTPFFDVDAFAGDHSRPLTCVKAIEQVTPDRRGVTLRCTTERIQRRLRDRYGTTLEVADAVGAGPEATIRIDLVDASVMRFRFSPSALVPEHPTPMTVGGFRSLPDVQLSETAQQLVLKTSYLTIALDRSPYRMRVYDRRETTLISTIPAAVYQHPPTGESEISANSLSDAWPWFFRGLFPLGYVRDETNGLVQTFDTSLMGYDEHFYGFGERFGPLDKRGQAIALWQANPAGETWPLSYKNIPFFLSTRGYGHFINSAYPISYHIGDRSHIHLSFHVQEEVLDYYLIAGSSFKEILPRYTQITGPSEMPPLWSFGLWMSRMSYQAQSQVESVADRLREERIPCDVIHVDTDWFREHWVNDLTFSSERFPNPSAMITHLRERGFRLSLWQIPYISVRSRLYHEGVASGYFATDASGQPRLIDGFFGPAAVIDFSNPKAVEWYCAALKPLLEMGVAAIKTDFGEGAPIDASYYGHSGLEMHNLYPLLYNKAIFELTKKVTGEGIIWGRSAYAGSQRYPVYWGGDPAVRWEDLANLFNGGLGLGLCGFPFWSHDIGGFAGTPTSELYIRWAQAGLFMTHPRAHGPIAREPWAFGKKATDIFRRYADLRYRLLPYIWSEAVRCVRTSQPVMRPMVFDWQNDPSTYDISDQFMLGENLLFAPIVSEDSRRRIYLPEGPWMEYWTSEVTFGPRWVEIEAELESLPVFLRAGAIVPMAPSMQHTGECDWNRLTLDIFPHDKSSFVLHIPEAREVIIDSNCRDGQTSLSISPGLGFDALRLRGLSAPQSVLVDGRAVSWSLDEGALCIAIPETEQVRNIAIQQIQQR